MEKMYCDVKLKIRNGSERGIGPGLIQLLEYIEETNSVASAARKMEMSVSKAWKIIRSTESHSKKSIISSQSGGANGGYTVLSQHGKNLISSYKKMEAECIQYSEQLLKKYYKDFIDF